MTGLRNVIRRGLELVVPGPAETNEVTAVADAVLKKTAQAASRFHQVRGVLLGGSFAKGTWVPRHVDLDIFVKFDPGITDLEFESIGLKIGAKATRGYPRGKKYAQHPYTEALVDGVKVNIVPCFDVKKGDWRSAADRSPFHVELAKSLTEDQKDQVRLLKSFMNGTGVYGAEIERQGFSGYAAEVLIRNHGTFEKALRWFADFRPANEDRLFSLPDPVDEGRDLGIAVSKESLGRMVLAAREFLNDPRPAFFVEMSARAHRSLGNRVVAVIFSHAILSEDTLWGELRKTTKHIVRHLDVLGFAIARSMAATDNKGRSAILLIPETVKLPQLEQRVGPTVDRRKDLDSFISTNSRRSQLNWVDDEARVRLLVPRKYTRIDRALSDVARGRAGPVGASRELEKGMKKNAKVLSGSSLARAAARSSWLQNGVREITSDAIGTS